MSLLLSYIKQYKKFLFLALVLATINQIFSLLDPQIFRILIDKYASHAKDFTHAEFIKGILLLLGASMGTAFVSRVAKNFQDYYVNVTTELVGSKLYSESIAHSFSLPFSIFEDQRSGELLQKLAKAKQDSQKLIMSFVNTVFLSLVGIIFVLSYGFIVNWKIGVAYFLIIPIVGIASFTIGRRIKKIQKNIVAQTADLSGSATETLRNVELVKSLGLEEQETKRLQGLIGKILDLELHKVRLIRALSFAQGTMLNATRTAIMFLMLYMIFTGEITVGQFFSLLFYSFALFNPLSEISTVSASYQEARASMETVQSILDTKPEEQPKNALMISAIENIAYDHVGFSYQSGQGDSLKDVSFNIQKGQTVAFVGPSGAGKSTLLKTLVGLYKPTVGVISINGTDSKDIDYTSIRRQVGYVSQDTQLFAGTIRENLLFVKPTATDEECLEALRAAAAMPIIENTGLGLDTRIGESGIKISGGQKQRLAIARALLRNPQLIIFDEATSSLDSLTENEITEAIKEIGKTKKDMIIVIVAHRLSTVSHADSIYVLEKGSVTEHGSHAQLLQTSGLYSAMWRQQNG